MAACVVAVGALAYGCAPTSAPRASAPPPPAAPPPPPPAVVLPSLAVGPTPPPVVVEVGFDPKAVTLVLDDPRLAGVKEAVAGEAYVKAVELLGAALAAPELDPDDRPVWLYQLGRLRVLAGDPLGAAKAFEQAGAFDTPLADHARYQAADLYARAGKHERALLLAKQVAPGLGIADELELVTASALAGTGDIDGAAKVWRAFLARSPRPWSWINVTLKFANALISHPSEARNEEAVKLARTVLDGSSGAGVGEAKEIEAKALKLLPAKKRKALETPSSDELFSRARRLAGAGQNKQALRLLELLAQPSRAAKTKERACDVKLLHASVLGKSKRKAESADMYDEAVEACKDTARHVDALFNAGRSLTATGRYAAGVKRLEELEKAYSTHRLADDARLERALAARANQDEATFAKLLAALPDDYPAGDMVNDGLFELGVHYAEKKMWAAAIGPLARAFALEQSRRERIYHSAGRFGYFLGRAYVETGNEAKGKELFVSVIQQYPLTYYMALAHARLAEIDPAAAKAAVDDAMAREAAEPFFVPPHPALKSPAFLRAVELVRQGDVKLARGELDLLGVGDRTAPREVLWASAMLFALADSPTQSHGMLRTAATTSSTSRTELTEWLEHYPAGRWRAAWELSFPRPFADLVGPAAAAAGIPEALAYAIMREESAFEPRVVSHAQAVGLMQLILPTAKLMAKPLGLPHDAESLKKPHVNIQLGCRYLGQLRQKFPDNVLLSIPGYNAGGGAPKKWLAERAGYDFDVWVERIPYDETQKYTKRVIGSMAAYELLYYPDRPTEARAAPRAASPAATAIASVPGPGTTSVPGSGTTSGQAR